MPRLNIARVPANQGNILVVSVVRVQDKASRSRTWRLLAPWL